MNRLQVMTGSALVVLASYCIALSSASAAIIGKVATSEAKVPVELRGGNAFVIGGRGGTAARAQAGGDDRMENLNGFPLKEDPADGDPFDDTQGLGEVSGKKVPALNNKLATEIGKKLVDVYPLSRKRGVGSALDARGLDYNVDIDEDKQNGDKLSSTAGPIKSKKTMKQGVVQAEAKAEQEVKNNKVTGKTEAKIVGKGARAFAAALNNDPTVFELEDPGASATIEFVIDSAFLLRADNPLLSALALFELATDRPFEGEILSLAIGIDGTTASESDVAIDVLDFNPTLFASEQAIEDDIRSQLSFDPLSHTLTTALSEEIVLFAFSLDPLSDPVTVTFNSGALTTARAVPEPATLTLFALGGSVLVLASAVRRRRKTE